MRARCDSEEDGVDCVLERMHQALDILRKHLLLEICLTLPMRRIMGEVGDKRGETAPGAVISNHEEGQGPRRVTCASPKTTPISDG
jgi:hypothetical protein